MSDDPIDWEKEFADDPDFLAIPPEKRGRLIRMIEKTLEWGIAAVYGDEDEGVPDADVPCAQLTDRCRAKCCTFIFALTKDEAERGVVRSNPERPFFIARDADGYCPHLDRETLHCQVWNDRPLRCRRYSCACDPNVWPEGYPLKEGGAD